MSDNSLDVFCLPSSAVVFAYKGKPVIDTVTIAELWGKQHKSVMRACRQAKEGLASLGQANRLKLIPIDYIDNKGRTQQKLLLDETAFFTVVGGFQGPKSTAMRMHVWNEFSRLRDSARQLGRRKPRLLHTAVFNPNTLFADFDRGFGLVEIRRIPESEMSPWQKIFSKVLYCTRNAERFRQKLDTELLPALRDAVGEVFGDTVRNNVIFLVEKQKKI